MLGFDMKIVHRPGIANILPDALSRLFPRANGGGEEKEKKEDEKKTTQKNKKAKRK